jgi:hypothetical protein
VDWARGKQTNLESFIIYRIDIVDAQTNVDKNKNSSTTPFSGAFPGADTSTARREHSKVRGGVNVRGKDGSVHS